jgi:glycosyltransferase involved in cell wall biosynthesis
MEIIFFHKSLVQYGGAEVVLFNDINSFIRNGFKVKLIVQTVTDKLLENIDKRVELIKYSTLFDLLIFFRKNYETPVICSSGIIDLGLTLSSKKNKLIVYDHHPAVFSDELCWHTLPMVRKRCKDFAESNNIFCEVKNVNNLRLIIRNLIHFYALKHARIVLVLSEFAKKEKVKLMRKECKIIYTGFNRPILKPYHNKYSLDRNDLVVITRLSYDKNLVSLIKAFKAANLIMKGALRLNIFGTGQQKDALEQLIKENELEGSVKLHGFVTEDVKWDILHSSNVFVNPQIADYNLTTLEALYAGCQIVTSSIDVISNEAKYPEMVMSADLSDVEAFTSLIIKSVKNNYKYTKFTMDNFRDPDVFTWDHRFSMIKDLV